MRGRPRKSKAAKREVSFGRNLPASSELSPIASSVQVGTSSDALEALEESLRIETIDELIEFGDAEESGQSDDIVAGIPPNMWKRLMLLLTSRVLNEDDDEDAPNVATAGDGYSDDDDDKNVVVAKTTIYSRSNLHLFLFFQASFFEGSFCLSP